MYILDDDGKDLLATVKEFCEKEVKEQCKEYDVTGEWPKEIYDKATEMGLGCLEVPEEYGGLGIDKITAAALYEEMAKADAGFFTTFAASNLGYKPVLIAGTEEQKQWASDILLEGGYGAFCLTEPMGGSDPACCKTTAVKDGDDYIINGRKCFITNGAIANFYVVTCATDKTAGNKGISAFLIPARTEGLSAGNEENKMGIRTSNTTDVVFEDVRVPASAMLGKEGEGFKIAMKILDGSRIGIGAVALGIAEGAFEEAVKYSKERKQFGKPICANQGIQWYIAEMATSIETARMLLFEAATLREQGKPYSKQAAMSKLYCSKVAREVTNLALQIHGGYGYMKEYTVERLYRDAKITEIYEGTSEIQKIVIAKQVLAEFK